MIKSILISFRIISVVVAVVLSDQFLSSLFIHSIVCHEMNEPMSKVQKAPACSNGAIGTHASNQVDEINSIEKDFEKLKTDSLIN